MAVSVIILAGGKGERFWPRSRESMPKQFIRLLDQGTMLQLTFNRARKMVSVNHIYVVTARPYVDLVKQQLPGLPAANIIVEPEGRNTAPCIGLAAILLQHKDSESVMVILPADHYVADNDRFVQTLKTGVRLATDKEAFITLGIVPTRPETGYGYIELGEQKKYSGAVYFEVKSFTEKPDYQTAQAYLGSGNFLWNSGMFIWKTSSILRAMETYQPQLYEGLCQIGRGLNEGDFEQRLLQVYGKLPKQSIDYAILEKANNILVVPGDFGWDDVGSWAALSRLFEVDSEGNYLQGSVVTIGAHNCIIDGKTKLIAAVGVDNLVVIDTEDVLLICPKERSQDIKLILEELRKQRMEKYL
ncbi:mannose-1-phosphate guanylyltransferase [Thermincola ferriacetica]|uniref:mannose-1-phosphate guanylyltransferase n=1 Tax=Thermincola ferriacetica TaxID=281456 RepID=A0A0L6W3F1_9FIRM|nr:mannose-1-phosphate guanylyltransferase [Thermincola ferriacetica]KNZ70065.1 mannose-1-phosphate guanylyltransferase [Thermincola ferriacetica]